MSDKPHEVLDLSALRAETPQPQAPAHEKAAARLQGRSFSQLSPAEKDELLMVIGCRLGIIVPEDPQH
jgi:hypothetical protein